MFDIYKGKHVCDKEIWSRKRKRWEGCKKSAKITIPSKLASNVPMDFCCDRHKQAYLRD